MLTITLWCWWSLCDVDDHSVMLMITEQIIESSERGGGYFLVSVHDRFSRAFYSDSPNFFLKLFTSQPPFFPRSPFLCVNYSAADVRGCFCRCLMMLVMRIVIDCPLAWEEPLANYAFLRKRRRKDNNENERCCKVWCIIMGVQSWWLEEGIILVDFKPDKISQSLHNLAVQELVNNNGFIIMKSG